MGDSNDTVHVAEQLGLLLAQLPAQAVWPKVEETAQTLANSLRVRNEDNLRALGRTKLPQTLTSLLKHALEGSPIPADVHASPVLELLRVSANFCMDHDENRGHLLEAGLPQEVVSMLEGYVGVIPNSVTSPPKPLPLSVLHLKVARTAIGVLLNTTLGYEPVRSRLASLEVAMTLLKLSSAVYPPGSWLGVTPNASTSTSEIEEEWNLRSSLSNWTWRTLEELTEDSRPLLGPDALPMLTPALLAFVPPYATPPSTSIFQEQSALRKADFDVLEESCTLLESLSLDIEDVRLSLARGVPFPAEHNGVPCLSNILDFIEKGDYPPSWSSDFDSATKAQMEKTFDICKAALIKAVVEVAGEEKNEDVLWDDTEDDHPGGTFVCRMVEWIRQSASQSTPTRSDLVICASLSLGNLARRETTSRALLSPPHSLAPILVSDSFLSPNTDIKVKHGVIGLLKHLAQSSVNSPPNRAALTESGVVDCLVRSNLWEEKGDAMTEVVQMGAIGVVKHLCNGSVTNACTLVLSPKGSSSPAGLTQIIALVRRSDTVAIKSEGTRVLVNVTKSLLSSAASSDSDEKQSRQSAIEGVLNPASAEVLAALIGRSMKYPLLVNEGVVALTLLSTQAKGSNIVLDAVLAPLPVEPTANTAQSGLPSASASIISDAESPVVTSPNQRTRLPSRALDRLLVILNDTPKSDAKSASNQANSVAFPIEVRANVCSLLGQISRKASAEQLKIMDDLLRSTLQELSKSAGSDVLGTAAKKTLDGWPKILNT